MHALNVGSVENVILQLLCFCFGDKPFNLVGSNEQMLVHLGRENGGQR